MPETPNKDLDKLDHVIRKIDQAIEQLDDIPRTVRPLQVELHKIYVQEAFDKLVMKVSEMKQQMTRGINEEYEE